MEKIIIIGGKGSAIVLAEQIYDRQEKVGDVEILGLSCDDPYPEVNGFPILSPTREVYNRYKKYEDVKFLYMMYRPDLIKHWCEFRDALEIPIEKYTNFIHQSAFVARSVKMGHGNVILAHSTVNMNTIFGNFNTVHSNAMVGHDCTFGDSNFITAQCAIGSNNHFGKGNFVGLNSTINNYTNIGNYTFIGMGSNVIKSLEDDVMVYGNPAKPRERNIKPL